MFDATAELAAVHRLRGLARRPRYHKSALEKHRAELVALRRAGASLKDLVVWLRTKRLKVAASTVSRYLRQLPELGGNLA
ncbi:MAG: hypothetical protein A2076_16710 [Geobacteraceae bacterium GWC2_53_11]|nr:MAG: hypothetical protein A2076_16710 [Geobacteraceae bacterium GWC2_53_11]